MKLTFIFFTFFFNFFSPFFVKADEIIDSSMNQIESNFNEKNSVNNQSEVKKIHIVKSGDTITSISKFYSIEKELIITLNDLKDENYIYVGQNLKISDTNPKSPNKVTQNIYHIVQKGESLTQISANYGIGLKNLIKINNLNDQDSIEIGSKIFLIDKNIINEKKSTLEKVQGLNKFVSQDNIIYGPIIIKKYKLKKVNNRKILNVLNQDNKKLIISLKCETKEIDVKIPGREWKGWMPAKENFEKNLINDFC